jgi:hypothetical protein
MMEWDLDILDRDKMRYPADHPEYLGRSFVHNTVVQLADSERPQGQFLVSLSLDGAPDLRNP